MIVPEKRRDQKLIIRIQTQEEYLTKRTFSSLSEREDRSQWRKMRVIESMIKPHGDWKGIFCCQKLKFFCNYIFMYFSKVIARFFLLLLRKRRTFSEKRVLQWWITLTSQSSSLPILSPMTVLFFEVITSWLETWMECFQFLLSSRKTVGNNIPSFTFWTTFAVKRQTIHLTHWKCIFLLTTRKGSWSIILRLSFEVRNRLFSAYFVIFSDHMDEPMTH